MKIEHILVEGVVHRMVTSALGHITVSCDLRCAVSGIALTVDPLTCFPCLVYDQQALRRKLKRQLTGYASIVSQRIPTMRDVE